MGRKPLPPKAVLAIMSLEKGKLYSAEEVALKVAKKTDPDFDELVTVLENAMGGVPPNG